MSKRIFAAEKKGSTLEILVYDIIGADWFGEGVTVAGVAAEIKSAGAFDSISVRINSPGGAVFEGVAIANLLRAQGKPVSVVVDGVAASAASVIAMAGDTVAMGQGAMMMIHNAWTMVAGDAGDLRKMADTLDKISASLAETYIAKTGKSAEEIKTLMDAETWMSAEECVSSGFADSVVARSEEEKAKAMALAATYADKFTNAPNLGHVEDPGPKGEAPEVDWEGPLEVYRKRLAQQQ